MDTSPLLFPHQDDVESYFGEKGESQMRCQLPFPMKLAWDTDKKITSYFCHEKVVTNMEAIWRDTLQEFGTAAIERMGLDLFGGCLNVRKMRNSNPPRWSMHSWGIAVDIHPTQNKLHWKADKALFARPEYIPFWRIVEGHGAVSLGRELGYDYMHFQFCRVWK